MWVTARLRGRVQETATSAMAAFKSLKADGTRKATDQDTESPRARRRAARRVIADLLAAEPQIPTATAQIAGLRPIDRAARLVVSKLRK